MTVRARRRFSSLPVAILAAAAFASPALAGTDGDDEFTPTQAPFVQPVATPPSVTPAPTAPPSTAAPESSEAPQALRSQPRSTHKKHTAKKKTVHAKTVVRHTVSHPTRTFVGRAVATPSGGVQAGAGGTAPANTPFGALLGGGLALLVAGGAVRAYARS